MELTFFFFLFIYFILFDVICLLILFVYLFILFICVFAFSFYLSTCFIYLLFCGGESHLLPLISCSGQIVSSLSPQQGNTSNISQWLLLCAMSGVLSAVLHVHVTCIWERLYFRTIDNCQLAMESAHNFEYLLFTSSHLQS